MVTHEDVIEVLRPVEDPELHRSIVDLGMVRDVVVATNSVSLTIVLTVPGCPLRNEIQRRVTDAVRRKLQYVHEVVMEERRERSS